QSCAVISPDLTTNNVEQQDYSGGAITRDNTGVEVYNTIFAFEESPHVRGLLWAGSDDGRVHLSRDAGASWKEITPKDMPPGGTVNGIELSAHDPGRAFIAVYRYRQNDFRPYIFRTNDYGASWDLLTDGRNGIPATSFTRAVREDPDRKGLLYAGTEFGMYLSVDDGAHWQRFQLNLPVTPVTDLRVHRKHLVVSTQGRAFWVLDDVSPLHQMADPGGEVRKSTAYLFAPRTAYRGGAVEGASLSYYFAEPPEEDVKLEVLDEAGEVIRVFEGKPGEKATAGAERPSRRPGVREEPKLPVEKGLNRFTWDLREKGPEIPQGVVHWGGAPGLKVVPGSFRVRLSSGDWSQTQPLEVTLTPNLTTTVAELKEQHALGEEVASEIASLFAILSGIRDVKSQADSVLERVKKAGLESAEVQAAVESAKTKLSELEESITQVKSKSGQDPINFPPQIDNQLTSLYGYVAEGDFPPTAGAHERFTDLKPELQRIRGRFDEVVAAEVAALNRSVAGLSLPPVVVPSKAATTDGPHN
ncbi:MAG TPA: glycosyl hydrolase, partial [Vicinamibacteria bacterium]|nr:glycosyl hydrolase [Vicinamibacteria bacterium]